MPLLAQTCARECALYQLLDPTAAEQAERVLTGYFGPAAKDKLLAVGERYEAMIAADKAADAPYR